MNRDPIGENGGINLYRFVSNSPSSFVDALGLKIFVNPSASDKFKDMIKRCMCELLNTAFGKGLLARADNQNILLNETDSEDPQVDSPRIDHTTGKIVFHNIIFNPENRSGLSDNFFRPGGPSADPCNNIPNTSKGCAAILAHELGHILEGEGGGASKLNNELYIIYAYENPARSELGLDPRPCRRDNQGNAHPIPGL